MVGRCQLHKPKQSEKSIDEQEIITIARSDDCMITDESLNT